MKKNAICIGASLLCFCALALGAYKVIFTLYVMNEVGLDHEELGQDFTPVPLDLEFSPPLDITPIFVTYNFSIALTPKIISFKRVGAGFMCETEDAKLMFQGIVLQREDLLKSLPGHEHLSTDQILNLIFNSRSSDIYLSMTPKQILRSVSLYKLKSILMTKYCKQEWYRVDYLGRKAFVAVGPKILVFDVPSIDGTFYTYFNVQKLNVTLEDASILNQVLVASGTDCRKVQQCLGGNFGTRAKRGLLIASRLTFA